MSHGYFIQGVPELVTQTVRRDNKFKTWENVILHLFFKLPASFAVYLEILEVSKLLKTFQKLPKMSKHF